MLASVGDIGSSNSSKGKVAQHHQNTMSVVEEKTKGYQDENKKRQLKKIIIVI
jgi:hypothetical protein